MILSGPLQRRGFYDELSPGDVYQTYNETGADVTVEVLTKSEPWTEPVFGRAGFRRFRGRRSDTGAEGWVNYGPGARAVLFIEGER